MKKGKHRYRCPKTQSMKRFILIALLCLAGFIVASAAWYFTKFKANNTTTHVKTYVYTRDMVLEHKIGQHKDALRQYAKEKGYSTATCFLVDMSIESGKNRFFVYDLAKDSVVDAGLVAHGCCNKTWLSGRQYSNETGCGCTSLGRYKIGKPYQGRFGKAYKLYGLDSSNSNAFNRFVVLHSFYAVPEGETAPYPICQSNGCPMVSQGFMQKLQTVLDKSSRPVLLWIYE